MPRKLTTTLPYAKIQRSAVPLQFRSHKNLRRQRRHEAREELVPDIDLSDYRFRAVIDWLDVVIDLQAPSQFQWLHAQLDPLYCRRCFIEASNTGRGTAATSFRIRFQEPPSSAFVLSCLNALSQKFPFTGTPRLSSLEISVDAYPRQPSDHARARLLGVLQRCFFAGRDIFTDQLACPRTLHARGDTPTYLLTTSGNQDERALDWFRGEHRNVPPVDATLYVGARESPLMWRLMDKVVDRQDPTSGTWVDLNDASKRVRVEVTLGAGELHRHGLHSVDDLQNLAYRRLQGEYFRFMRPSFREEPPPGSPMIELVREQIERRRLEVFMETGILGLEAYARGKRTFVRRHRPNLIRGLHEQGKPVTARSRVGDGSSHDFIAFKELNRCVSDALANLGERESRAWRGRQ